MTAPGTFGRKAIKRNFVVNRKGDLLFGFRLGDPDTLAPIAFPEGTKGVLEIGSYEDFQSFEVEPSSDGAMRWKLESEVTDQFETGEQGRVYIHYTTTTPTTEVFAFKGKVTRDD